MLASNVVDRDIRCKLLISKTRDDSIRYPGKSTCARKRSCSASHGSTSVSHVVDKGGAKTTKRVTVEA